jgi:ParB family transcriptional regulator, chromosome partitioning protein
MENNKENINKKRLGRGLGSLLGGASSEQMPTQTEAEKIKKLQPEEAAAVTKEPSVEEGKRIWEIAIDKLVPGQFQPRKHFDKAALEELAQSIRANGILQPITVRRRKAGGFEIVAGERRWRAAQIAGFHEVPAIIKEYTDKEALQLALIENVQREDLDPVEEAESYQRLMQEFNYSQVEVAEKVGKERSTVANAIRLIALPNEIKEMLSEKLLSVGHAKALLTIQNRQAQVQLAKQIIEKGLSVRATENLVKPSNSEKNETEVSADSRQPMGQDLSQRLAKELADQLQKKLGTKVEINYKSGKGDINIKFYSDDQLNSIYEKMSQ